jgi:Fe-S cluster assembly protein SufB
MVHLGRNTRSTIVSKGISAGKGQNTYRGLVRIGKNASGSRNYSQCDSLLIGDRCGAHTFTEDAVNMIVNGFCKEVFRELPMEFAVEAQKLLGVSLEGSVG